ncbi:MAG: hypothetical protein Q9195_007183 [Heterodermia aff. obscurata]
MLPDIVQSAYKTYKQDTNAIATWLATKAKQCGYSADLLDQSTTTTSSQAAPSSARLKGKARKQAKNDLPKGQISAQGPSATLDEPKPPIYTIRVKEFITLANFIVGSEKLTVHVPEALAKALDRAILLRNQYTSGAGGSTESDKGHAYFLGVLEKTREILKPRMPPGMINDRLTKTESDAETNETPKLDADANEQVRNIFASLELEEPSQEFLDAPNIKPVDRTTPAQPRYEVETVQTIEEEYIAAHCLFEDVRHIRRFLCQLWTNYQEGMDLIAVSVTVNTAIGFIRDMEQDLIQRFPSKTDYESIVKTFFSVQCMIRGHNPGSKQRPDDIINMAVYDLAEDVMMTTFIMMNSVQDVIQGGYAPIYKPGHLGYRDTSSSWKQKTAREKVQDDKLALMEVFSDLFLFADMTAKSTLAEDELIRGIRQMRPGRDVPIWLVFAAQCFLDAQHELHRGVSNGYSQLVRCAKGIKSSIEETLKFHENLRIVNWPRTNDIQFKEQIRVIDQWVLTDVVAERLRKMKESRSLPGPEPFRLLKQYPVMCGLFAFALKMRAQEVNLVFVNAWGSIMYSAQLYNAVRQESLVLQVWKDMEFIIAMQGGDKFFVGDAPKGLEEYLKRYLLSMGYSAAIFAANRRPNANVASSKGPRSLTKLCAVAELFAGRYCNNDAAVSWTPEIIKPIIEAKLDDSDHEDADDDETGSRASKPASAQKKKPSSSGALLRKPKQQAHSLPTNEFLLDIANSLHAECLEMSIDYLGMHLCCWKLLRQVNEVCKPRLLQTYGAGYLEKENQLPFVVGYIFMAATATSQIANVLVPRREGVEVSSRLLQTSAEPLKELIESARGDSVTRGMEDVVGFRIDFSGLEIKNDMGDMGGS